MKLSNKALKICIMFLLLVTTVFGERLVTLPGSIQSALGGKDWAPDDYITRMKEVSEDLYIFEASLPKGNYDYKVAIDGSWTENYGSNGAKDGVDIPLVITTDNTKVKFTFDYKNKTIKHEIPEIEGFFFMPIVTSKVEQKGIDAPLLVTNELELGVLSKSWVVKSKFNYNFEHDDDKANKLTNIGDDADIKNLKIAELNADYTTKGITTGIMVNKANLKNSKDYLGIFDVDTETNKRHDGRKNPVNIAANSYGVKLSTEKFAKFDFATVKYVDDIYEKSDTERTFTQLNLEKSLLKDKLTLGTSNLLYQVTLDGKDEDLLINSALYAKLALSNKLTLKGELAYIPTGSVLESKGLQVLYKGGNTWEFTVTPISFGIKDEITDMHLVGGLDPSSSAGTGNQWNPSSKTYKMEPKGDVWVGTFTLPSTLNIADTKVKFVYNGSTWDKNIGVGGQNGSDFPLAELIPKGEGLKNGFNAYYADLDYKLGNKGSIQAGTKFVAENSYMPFAKDDLLYRENYDSIVNRKNGIVDYWLNADYQLSKNNSNYSGIPLGCHIFFIFPLFLFYIF